MGVAEHAERYSCSIKVLIATFSQFGTTAAIGDEIIRGLQSAGAAVDSVRIGGGTVPDLTGYDMVGIGAPAYMFRPPFPVTDFLRELPGIDGKPFFTFVLYGTHRGATGNCIRRRLLRAGGVDAGYFTARGADVFIGYLREGVLFSPDHPTGGERTAAREFGVIVAGRAEQIRRDVHARTPPDVEVEPYDPPTPVLYALERASLNRFFIRTTLARAFRADDRCISCGVCVKRCPTGNISLSSTSADARPEWGTDCLMCGVCALVCPVDAVRSPYDWGVNRLFMKLNVRRGKRTGVPYRSVDPGDTSASAPFP